jgi:pyridoxal 5'-phosphate synthase pdxS subunit
MCSSFHAQTMPKKKSSKQDVKGTFQIKSNLAQMLKGGVIMDVTNAEQARIAEKAGAVAVMALERVPADIRAQGGVARMSDPKLIKEIQAAVSIPVMAKVRIGHFMEARILEALQIDFIDESEVLTPADTRHVDKKEFRAPFVCGATGLGEALRRIQEGAAMIRTKGEAGTGDVIEAVRHMRQILEQISRLKKMTVTQLKRYAADERVELSLLNSVRAAGKLPVVNFAAGGIATPADAALLMQIGAEGVFVGSGIFKSKNPVKRARAIVLATMHYDDPQKLAEVSADLEDPMFGIQAHQVETRLQERGLKL